MSLDDRRQAMLDAFCHVYGVLLDYFDDFDDAVYDHPQWDGYRVVKDCINPAAERFGKLPIESIEPVALCQDLLGRIEGSLSLEFPSTSSVFSVLAEFKNALLGGAVPGPADIELFRDIGEKLSIDCYRLVCPPDSPNLCRPTNFVIVPSNQHKFCCQPNKCSGISTITFGFSTSEFTFDSFVNLPFYFLHEYLSHIHSAELFAEKGCAESSPPFEDGWLLYAAHCSYCQCLWHNPSPSLSNPNHREYYVGKYLSRAIEDTNKSWVRLGNQLARNFKEIVGPDLFWKVTMLLATSPFNHLPVCPDLHQEFMIRTKPWIRRISNLSNEKRREGIELMALAVDDDEPIQSLIDILS